MMNMGKKSVGLLLSVLLGLGLANAAIAASSIGGAGLSMSPSLLSLIANDAAAQAGDPQTAQPTTTNINSPDQLRGKKINATEPAVQDRIAAPDEAQFKSEFQDFVAHSVGQPLPMYGYELFRQAPDTFSPVNNIPVTPDYIVGPGDELLVHVWGRRLRELT